MSRKLKEFISIFFAKKMNRSIKVGDYALFTTDNKYGYVKIVSIDFDSTPSFITFQNNVGDTRKVYFDGEKYYYERANRGFLSGTEEYKIEFIKNFVEYIKIYEITDQKNPRSMKDASNILLLGLNHVNHFKEFNDPKYYYQYEYDSGLTLYESLMNTHQICIEAYSDSEAEFINLCLRVLIDANLFALEQYIENEEEGIIYFVDFLQNVTSLKPSLSVYEGYVSEEIKAPEMEDIRISGDSYLTSDEISPVKVFNYLNVKKILDMIKEGSDLFDPKITGGKQAILNIFDATVSTTKSSSKR